jgi:hypothetical protein
MEVEKKKATIWLDAGAGFSYFPILALDGVYIMCPVRDKKEFECLLALYSFHFLGAYPKGGENAFWEVKQFEGGLGNPIPEAIRAFYPSAKGAFEQSLREIPLKIFFSRSRG